MPEAMPMSAIVGFIHDPELLLWLVVGLVLILI
jgi:hypothetical protein